MSERTQTIERWITANVHHMRPSYASIRNVRDGHGLIYAGSNVEVPGNGTLAHFIRDSEDELGPLIRLALPNQVTIRRFREIHRIARDKGVPVVCVPRAVLEEADIRQRSIRVIHTEARPRMFRPPHQVIEALVWPRWDRKAREAFFLSGYDLNERGLSYFFCELPTDVAPESIDHAYRMLQPESVKRAHAQRRKVYRQGDMFFIRAKDEEGPAENDIEYRAYLFGSNHRVAESARHNGLLMVRGKVEHRPQGRRPDHKTLRLPGRGWYIAVQNAVRTTKR